ncbi:putative hydrolase [Bacillus methanolicus PB1]|uniref:Putative hydrolase n=1 Tax=Bacillus methanolicus PB1 TaxID=997296 RepID=I3E207_BACMT|nr:HAD hydrolase-like protein [Bacillus methanolicus]EIJ80528.1 putative hydrolase [Bacillus methanolicus PB1]
MRYLPLNKIQLDQYSVIGFDMDGTLYDEEIFIRQVYGSIAKYLSDTLSDSFEFIYSWMMERWEEKGSSYPFIFSEVIEQVERIATEELIDDCLNIYRNFKPILRLNKNVEKFLNEISKEHQLFLITDGNFKLQKEKFNSLRLENWFREENIVFTGKFGREFYKPSVRAIEYIECLKNITKPVLYFGDRNIDEQFALNAQFDFVKIESFNCFWDVK